MNDYERRHISSDNFRHPIVFTVGQSLDLLFTSGFFNHTGAKRWMRLITEAHYVNLLAFAAVFNVQLQDSVVIMVLN